MPPRSRRTEILDIAADLFATSGLRTSIQEIADACGIVPATLYHHFDSKEAIIIELVRRCQDDLGAAAADARATLVDDDPATLEERVITFGREIAPRAVRHRATLILTLDEPPTTASDELVSLSHQMPTAVDDAMFEILRSGSAARAVRRGVDLRLLAQRLCQALLHFAIGDSYQRPDADEIPALRCRLLLDGLAASTDAVWGLGRSVAIDAADRAIAAVDEDEVDDKRLAHLRVVARTEFGRRGFDNTTMRDVASASGINTAIIYRYVHSKEELLASVMQSYRQKRTTAWDAVMRSSASPLEKLDALIWVNIAMMARFGDEFRVELGLLRRGPGRFHPGESSPAELHSVMASAAELRSVTSLLASGERGHELRLVHGTPETYAPSVFEAIWVPEAIVLAAGTRGAQDFARSTLLAGAPTRHTGQEDGAGDRVSGRTA